MEEKRILRAMFWKCSNIKRKLAFLIAFYVYHKTKVLLQELGIRLSLTNVAGCVSKSSKTLKHVTINFVLLVLIFPF